MSDDLGGVWRTIGGRRVFIKNGQDLASAMKASGKFKNFKEKTSKKIKTEKDLENQIKAWEDFKKAGGTEEDLARDVEETRRKENEENIRKFEELKQKNINKLAQKMIDEHPDTKRQEIIDKIKNTDAEKINKKDSWTAEEQRVQNLANEINNLDIESKEKEGKWTARDAFLTRMKRHYNNDELKKIRVLEENEDYLAYTEHTSDGDYIIITNSYNRNSDISEPPDIYIRKNYGQGERTLDVQINWPSYGAKNIEQTDEFIKKIQNASNFAKKLSERIKNNKKYNVL